MLGWFSCAWSADRGHHACIHLLCSSPFVALEVDVHFQNNTAPTTDCALFTKVDESLRTASFALKLEMLCCIATHSRNSSNTA